MAIAGGQVETGLDTTDLDVVVRAHYDAVFRVCLCRLGSRSDAEDAAQEVFCRAVQHRHELVGDPLPWLLRTATNLCADTYRRKAARPVESDLDPESPSDLKDGDPERQVVGRMALSDMLSCLTKSEKNIVVEKWLFEGTHREAGSMLGVSAGTTKKLLSRAKQRLLAYVEAQEDMFGAWVLAAFNNLPRPLRVGRRANPDHALLAERISLMAMPAIMAAALALTVGGGELAAGGAVASGRGSGETALAIEGHRAVPALQSLPGQPQARSNQSGAPRNSDVIGPLLALNPPARQQDVGTTDIQPSPDYSSDHQVFAIGVRDNCPHGPCNVLFRTEDNGVSWHQLPAAGLTGTQLLLPESSFSSGRFYAFGTNGVEMTTDNGNSFQPLASWALGYAAAAPQWRSGLVSVSNAGIWDFSAQTTPATGLPTLDGAFPAGYRAVGAAVFTPNHLTFQPAVGAPQALSVTQVLTCAQTCGSPVALPWEGTTNLRVSPQFSTDGSILALVAGQWVAVSRDGGRSYNAALLPTDVFAKDAEFIEFPGRVRMVGLISQNPASAASMIWRSDDLGNSWTASQVLGLSQNVRFSQLRRVSASLLMAATDNGNAGSSNGFACSRDGGLRWRDCAAG